MQSEFKDPQINHSILQTNIFVVSSIVELIGSSFGPLGNFKFVLKDINFHDSSNFQSVITAKSGYDIIKNIQIQHPIGNLLARVCSAQNDISSDGTCYVLILTGLLLNEAAKLITKGHHPNFICSNFTQALEVASQSLEQLKIPLLSNPLSSDPLLSDPLPSDLLKLQSYIIHPDIKNLYSLCYSALSTKILDDKLAMKMSELCINASDIIFKDISVKELYEGRFSLQQFQIVPVAVVTPSYYVGEVVRGFIVQSSPVHFQMPELLHNPKILIIQDSLEPIHVSSSYFYHANENAEERKKLKFDHFIDFIVKIGVKVILCSQGIDSRSSSKFASNGILALANISNDLIYRYASAIECNVVSSLEEFSKLMNEKNAKIEEVIGEVSLVQVRTFQTTRRRITIFSGVKDKRMASLIIGSSSTPMMHSMCRGVFCGMAAIKNAYEDLYALPGAGASEIAMGEFVRQISENSPNQSTDRRSVWKSFAKSLEKIPLILATNLHHFNNFHSLIDLLRSQYKETKIPTGVNLKNLSPFHPVEHGVLDGYRVKVQALACAVEAVNVILRIDRILQAVPLKPNDVQITNEDPILQFNYSTKSKQQRDRIKRKEKKFYNKK